MLVSCDFIAGVIPVAEGKASPTSNAVRVGVSAISVHEPALSFLDDPLGGAVAHEDRKEDGDALIRLSRRYGLVHEPLLLIGFQPRQRQVLHFAPRLPDIDAMQYCHSIPKIMDFAIDGRGEVTPVEFGNWGDATVGEVLRQQVRPVMPDHRVQGLPRIVKGRQYKQDANERDESFRADDPKGLLSGLAHAPLRFEIFAGVSLILLRLALTICGLQRGTYAVEAVLEGWRYGWLRLGCWSVLGLSGAGLGAWGLSYALGICAGC